MSPSPSWKMVSYAKSIAFLFSCLLAASVSSQTYKYDHPTANLSTKWIKAFNSSKLEKPLYSPTLDSYTVRPILVKSLPREADWWPNSIPSYACGFYCSNVTCDSYLFSITIVYIYEEGGGTFFENTPQVVWSANRNHPVGENATVELTNGGDLLLRDADGTLVWSANTSGKAVAGLNLTEMGNLVVFDANNFVVWQSFDHPTDSLLVGQILPTGKNLTAAASATDWSAGLYSVSMTDNGLVASILSHPPQVYSQISFVESDLIGELSYAKFLKGNLVLYANVSGESSEPDRTIPIRSTRTQYIKLEADGHLRVYEWDLSWTPVDDIFPVNECLYPMVCGEYGICTNGQCSCLETGFRQKDVRRADLGYSEVVPLACDGSDKHRFLELNDMTYFTFSANYDYVSDISNTDVERCKEACSKKCSCKAAMFSYRVNSSDGDCYLPTEILSLINNEKKLVYHNSSVSIKIQIPANGTSSVAAKGRPRSLGRILGSTLGVLLGFVLIGVALFVYRRRKRRTGDDVEVPVMEEDYLDHVPGMPTRFSFQELAAATDNFSNKLGEGGFGSVYKGSLSDGTRIAVKRLDGVGHIKKSFLAEVESIGSIHHINLVRLIGFCAEKFNRLLVYEYMSNGSLEKWIYSGRNETSLDWSTRRKIILDVAKGLAYLHEDCRQKILHLDIKPQNILLDEHYNVKLADFGLSKLVDRNQSQVVTTMRGTPGYLAPEWLDAIITEKLDVYSFGVVVLEILTGRRIFEESRPEEERHLLTLFKRRVEEGQWLDLVDECCQDEAEAENLMQISAWCVQSDHEKRPSMSMVMKVMEGAIAKDVLKEIDFNLLIPRYLSSKTYETSSSKDVTPLAPLLLSGPR